MSPSLANNFIHYDWSGNRSRQNHLDKFHIHYSPVKGQPHSFLQESLNVAQQIYEVAQAKGLELSLLMSGGIDSEFMARCFLRIEAPFKAYYFQYQKNMNYDRKFLMDFIARNQIPLEIIHFDENIFLEDEIWSYAQKYKIHEPFAAFDIRRFETVPGFPVMASGDIVLEQRRKGEITSFEPGSLRIPQVYLEDHDKPAVYQFFQYSPEIMLAFLTDPIIRAWIERAERVGFPDSRHWKQYLFRSCFPEIKPRYKWTGYERFGDLYLETQAKLTQLYGYEKDIVHIPLKNLIAQLSKTSIN